MAAVSGARALAAHERAACEARLSGLTRGTEAWSNEDELPVAKLSGRREN